MDIKNCKKLPKVLLSGIIYDAYRHTDGTCFLLSPHGIRYNVSHKEMCILAADSEEKIQRMHEALVFRKKNNQIDK